MKPSTSPIKRQTVTASVTELIRGRIIAGEYPGGFQIRQEAIADELGVSRIPVREALVQLEGEGLVVIHTHRGAVVAPLNEADAVDIFEARLLLEPFMIELAIGNATDEDIGKVRQCMSAYAAELGRGASPAVLSALNWSFHEALTQPADRPRTLTIIASLYNAADRYLRLQINDDTAKARAVAGHEAIAEAFAKRDAPLAKALLKKHIADAHRDVIEDLRKAGM